MDQLGQPLPHRSGAAMEVHVLEEQLLAAELLVWIIDSCLP
jgi:hypothetical protein